VTDARSRSLDPEFFDQMYAEADDPWGFETREYEARKYAETIAALPRERYSRGFEVGCSIGVLTEMLAARCGQLLSVDVVEKPLMRARERCAGLDHVSFELMRVPEQFPCGTFDLIVVSEVGYYWSPADLARARDLIIDHLMPDGHLLLVHWRPDVAEYPLTGDEVHDDFLAHAGNRLRHLAGRSERLYRLDLFERC
jgi:SAM-dependent methyltransferase